MAPCIFKRGSSSFLDLYYSIRRRLSFLVALWHLSLYFLIFLSLLSVINEYVNSTKLIQLSVVVEGPVWKILISQILDIMYNTLGKTFSLSWVCWKYQTVNDSHQFYYHTSPELNIQTSVSKPQRKLCQNCNASVHWVEYESLWNRQTYEILLVTFLLNTLAKRKK